MTRLLSTPVHTNNRRAGRLACLRGRAGPLGPPLRTDKNCSGVRLPTSHFWPPASGLWLVASLLLLASCQIQPPPPASSGSGAIGALVVPGGPPPRVDFLDPQLHAQIAHAGDRSVVRPDGRLHVEVDFRNLSAARLQVQLKCVFLDEQGLPTGDETPWETLFLTENSTETVPFDSLNPLARTFTVRLRVTR